MVACVSRLVLAGVCTVLGGLVFACVPAAGSLGVGRGAEGYVIRSKLGGEGFGNGEFRGPLGVAVDDSTNTLVPAEYRGSVYVADSENKRVERFVYDEPGERYEYESQFDGEHTPEKEFHDLTGLAVDDSGSALDASAGDVYAVEDGAHPAVERFTAGGEYVGSVTGREACAPVGGVERCEGKGTPVAFGPIAGVAVDSEGDLWVYEGRRRRCACR